MSKKPRSKIISYKEAAIIAKRLHRAGKKIVFKTGCFDIFHIGHAKTLEKIKNFGDVLFVGVGTDHTLRKLKGGERPIFPERVRAELVAFLEPVNYVVILQEPLRGRIDHEKIISLVRPHYYVLPPDDKAFLLKKKMAKRYGMQVKLMKFELKFPRTRYAVSSTRIQEKVLGLE